MYWIWLNKYKIFLFIYLSDPKKWIQYSTVQKVLNWEVHPLWKKPVSYLFTVTIKKYITE